MALHNYGNLCREVFNDNKSAQSMFLKAYKLASDNPMIICKLAAIHFDIGEGS